MASPYSRGEVGLTSSDPLAPPRIDPRLLSDARDAEIMLKGVKLVPQLADAAGEAITKMHLAHMVLEYGDDEMQLKIGAIEGGI